MGGLRLALSWLSVLPVPVGRVDERVARHAITAAPLVGALLGALAAAVLGLATLLGAPPLLAGLLAVTALALLTRGMHVDGLADTVDGLGCYGPPERALAVMRDGGAGPFAVVALILVVGVQATSLAELSDEPAAVVLACAAGRAGFLVCCRTGVPAARREGLGALVAGSQRLPVVLAWWAGLVALGALGAATGLLGWGAVAGLVLALAALLAVVEHVRRRFGGITGDVLGFATEVGTTLVLAAAAFG
ncbi:adenosylcobinamide-GDP ribazoletransferase [Saccharopolyspora cebuensis]|uniref:Adenosylcobinamide-GDP ribazoletransferase n=1 Tax=Saccharopolyspora cebuensis TaxID=418759 RepID=A0ABV4CJZ7_9PSEU